ncbi:MAG: hypothetical protein IPL78_06200 [Chloroflexi bacterium]|nr:hypothetical protein [Chloroflexota bacterium]
MNTSPEPDPDPLPKTSLHRHKKRHERRPPQESFLSRHLLELALLFCLIAGVIFLLNPLALLGRSFTENASTLTNMESWLVDQGGSQIVGGLLLLLAFPLALLSVRKGVLYNQQLWRRNGCPGCGRDELRRTNRIWLDRILNALGIPVRRYICARCHWSGARIDESHL